VAGCGSDSIDFRPLAKMNRLPNFVRIPNAFSFEGSVNDDVTGPLSTAELSYAVDGGTPMVTPVPTDGSPFSIPVARQASGSLIEYSLSVETTSAETFETKTRAMQTGLSGEPLVMVSKNGSFEISAVDTKTMHEIDATADGLSYPLGQAFHKAYYGLYSANFGSDDLTFTPFWNAELLPLTPLAFDTDGDGLLDALEPLFGTDSALPDTDGDRSTDGVEISEFRYTVSGGGPTYFEIVGGTVAGDGLTPIGSPYVNLALYDVTGGGWATGAMRITPSGRYRMKLTAGNTYRIYFYDAVGGGSLGGSSDFSGAAGEIVDAGVKQVALSPPAPPTADTGTDPLDPLWGAGLFVPGTWGSYFLDRSVALESGADPWDVVLSPDGLSAYVSGSGTDKVYRIDTASGTVADEAAVGTDPKGLDLTPDGAKLYVANNVSQDVSVLNAATLGPITTIPLSSDPWGVSITEDGASAVVTTDGTADLAFLDVATDSADGTLDLSFSHLYFLGARMPSGDDALAGPFQFGTHELAVIDIPGRTASTIDLGASIDATAGVAWNPDEDLGYAVHYGTPELLEFDSATGAVQRTCPFEWIDIRDISLVEAPVLLRDDSIAALQPPPDVSDVFPLRIYRDPAPELPFTDEAGLLSDPTRPLVFYRYLGIDTITLTKDETIGIESVIIDQ